MFGKAPFWLRLCLLQKSPAKCFSEGTVFQKSRFGETINYGSSKMALAPPEEPLRRRCTKHPLN